VPTSWTPRSAMVRAAPDLHDQVPMKSSSSSALRRVTDRKYERVRMHGTIGVHVHDLPVLEARGHDLSCGGLCIVMDNTGAHPVVPGDRVTFRVQLSDRRPHDLEAEVRYVVSTVEGTFRVGLEWVDLEPTEQSMLQHLVARLREHDDALPAAS